ncbi:beta-glucoside-specific PTS transporter subunit IIABC [Paenibacillus sp. MER 99-2]|uniref:beta-glucoside-specific PTS transporter subunit IIABC n=1 Tax=Paenibacillus sp. MER 99-2 TaxID=2939572 RepID=UPI00203C0AF7|nr:beta-glucoside-specific PTS transporter subunit IIABC [Paenibacillus sp. MER 99-2]MCM3172302.1 beta-glucoside-specific PTS transporter subunit IIABC [Paenibacillus sp. MER 99-2]
MDYRKLGHEITELVGKKDNIARLTHCATRLRFELHDISKAETEKLKALPGVITVVNNGGQYQVVVGNEVQQVYRAITQQMGSASRSEGSQSDSSNSKAPKQKQSWISRFISVISTTFTPVIPAIIGAGMIKAILAVLVLTGLVTTESQNYYILNTIADAAFYFMPILLAYGASIKFETSPILAMTVAGVLLHPGWSALMSEGKDVFFIGVPVRLTDYAGSVLPIIIVVWLMSYIERFAERVSPSMIKFFTKPMLVLLITAPLALVAIGPFGTYLNDLVAMGAEAINDRASWLIPLLMGTLQPFLIVTGTAWAMTPIATSQLTKNGYEMINGPGMLASNIAQGGATLAVALKTKNKKLKQLAASSGFTAVLGITEPSLYGVTLKLKKPLIAAMIGGGVAGIYAGLTGLVRYAFVSPGLAALPAFIGSNPMNIVHAIVTCLIAFVVTFALTWVIGFDDPVDDEERDNTKANHDEALSRQSVQNNPQGIQSSETTTATVTPHNKLRPLTIVSPLQGELVHLDRVPDDVFSLGLLGKGAAIIPAKGELYAPITGEVTAFMDSKHAIKINGYDGEEVLIHIGVDTVNLKGRHFESSIKVGDRVQKGDLLIRFDIDAIKAEGYEVITPIIVANSDRFPDMQLEEQGSVKVGTTIIYLSKQA